MRRVQKNAVYRHFKGDYYLVVDIAYDATNHESLNRKMVVYRSLKDNMLYVRDLKEFISEVNHKKYPDVKQKFRFQQINTNKVLKRLFGEEVEKEQNMKVTELINTIALEEFGLKLSQQNASWVEYTDGMKTLFVNKEYFHYYFNRSEKAALVTPDIEILVDLIRDAVLDVKPMYNVFEDTGDLLMIKEEILREKYKKSKMQNEK